MALTLAGGRERRERGAGSVAGELEQERLRTASLPTALNTMLLCYYVTMYAYVYVYLSLSVHHLAAGARGGVHAPMTLEQLRSSTCMPLMSLTEGGQTMFPQWVLASMRQRAVPHGKAVSRVLCPSVGDARLRFVLH